MPVELHPAAVVYVGPTYPGAHADRLPDVSCLPPIKRRDLALLPSSVRIVGIVDGEFYQSLAVSPKEILPLLQRGITVYGASSMGALRAVELHSYGMVGVGSVFRLFRAGVLDADDEVALAYTPGTFQSVSEPLINTRYALRAAVRQGILARTEAAAIIGGLKNIYFPDRTREALFSFARDLIGSDRALQLRNFLNAQDTDVKRRDALRMIERIRRDLAVISRNSDPAIGAPYDKKDLDSSGTPQIRY